jgi:serine/threonine protein kinase
MENSYDQWEMAHALGEGAYGEVRLAINSKTQESRAIKIISLNLLNDKTILQKEVLIHKTLNHENIIKFFSSYEEIDKFYIIMVRYLLVICGFLIINHSYSRSMQVVESYLIELNLILACIMI